MSEQQDNSFPELINQDGRLSDWFKTDHSKAFQKSLIFEESSGRVNYFDNLENFGQENWNQQQFNKKADRKQQNRQNSKRARDRKKQEIQIMKNRIMVLENQNQKLRQSKVCSWCKRNLEGVHHHYAKVCSAKVYQQSKNKQIIQDNLLFEQIKPDRKPNRAWNAKVWIALGVLMLIIGLQLFDLDNNTNKPIRIRQKQMKQWSEKLYQQGPGSINIKLKNHPPQYINQKSKTKDEWRGKTNWFERIQIQNDQDYLMNEDNTEQLDLQIDKDLLFSIQAEFDDIGRYI